MICVVFTQLCDSTIFDVSVVRKCLSNVIYVYKHIYGCYRFHLFYQCYILGVLGHHLFSVSLLKFVLAVSHIFVFGHKADAKISTKYFNLKIFRGFVVILMADTAIDRMIGSQSSSSLISLILYVEHLSFSVRVFGL